ncbi:MAG: phage holin family protein [Clostridiales bacterium]|nr:phage holin family protein [Clostridiales bacterium]
MENVALIGVPVPEVIKRALEMLREKGDKKDDTDG